MIPPVLADLAQSVAKSYHRCEHMLTMLGASIASCVLHRHYCVHVFDNRWEKTHLPFWVLVRAPSGYGKSTLLRPFLTPIEEFEQYEQKRRMNYAAEVRSHYGSKKVPESKLPPTTRGWRMKCGDMTPESIVRGVRLCDGSMDLFTDEGRSFIKTILGEYKGQRSAVSTESFAALFDGGTIAVNRATGEWSDAAYNVTGTIGILTHEDMFDELFRDKELRTGGFVARLFVCMPEDVVGHEPPEAERPHVDPAAVAKWKITLEVLWKTVDPGQWMDLYVQGQEPEDWHWDPPEKRKIRIGDEGQRRLMEYSDEVNRDQRKDGRFYHERPFAAKLVNKVARLAAIFHALENPYTFAGTDVSLEMIETAIGLAEIEVRSRLGRYEGALGGLGETEREHVRRVAAVLLGRFHKSRKAEISWTKRSLKDLRFSPEERYQALCWLVDEQILHWQGHGAKTGEDKRTPRWEDQWTVALLEPDRLAAIVAA